MAIEFFADTQSLRTHGTTRVGAAARKGKIKSSKDVDGIEIRMLPPFIKDNHTTPVWPFPGFSKLYGLTIVVSDATNQLVGNIDLQGFPRIGDNEYLPVNKTIFYWQSATAKDQGPNQIHVFCSIIKSKQALRDTGKLLTKIKGDKDYKSVVGDLAKVVKDAAKFNLVADTVVQLAGIVGKYLGAVEDKPIGTVINSYTTVHGDFDNIGITPLLYSTKDTDFKFEVIVRDKTKGAAKTAARPRAGAAKPGAKKAAASLLENDAEDQVEVQMESL